MDLGKKYGFERGGGQNMSFTTDIQSLKDIRSCHRKWDSRQIEEIIRVQKTVEVGDN